MPRRVVDSRLFLNVRKTAAYLHYRTRAETWFAPPAVIISHPKCGRTWLRVMLSEAGVRHVFFSHAGSSEHDCVTIRSSAIGVRSWRDKRILLLIRDPRDTAVSFFFQATRRSRAFSGNLGEFLGDPRFGLERVIQFNLLWLSCHRQFAGFTVLSYEDLHTDPYAALSRAARFLSGSELAEADVQRAVDRSTFERLHRIELSGEGARRWGMRLSPSDSADPESFKTRRGIVGGWRDYFSSHEEAYALALLRKYDYFAKVERVQNAIHRSSRLSAEPLQPLLASQ